MKNVKIKTALTAVTLAAAALATSLPAYAGDYNRKCKDTNNSVAGGLIGGSVGAAIGEGIAGRGDNTEGAILGAIIGGIAGAAIGDGANDCEKDNRYNNRRVVTTTNHYPTRTQTYPTRTQTYPTRTTSRGYQTVGHSGHNHRTTTNRTYGNTRGYNTSYGYGRTADPLYRIDREIEETRREGKRLKRELKYGHGHRRGLRRALEANGYRLEQLKRERRRIKKYADGRRNDYRPQTRRGHYHGQSRNLCYSDH